MFKKVLDDSKSRNKKIASNIKKGFEPIKEDLARTKEIWAETREELSNLKSKLAEMKTNKTKTDEADLSFINTQQEFNQLKSGDQYINSDGDHMKKP